MKNNLVPCILFALLAWDRAFAQSGDADLRALQEQVRRLEETNRKLTERVEQLEQRLGEQEHRGDSGPPPATPPPSVEPPDGTKLEAFWRNGLRFESGDGDFRLRVGGRVSFDATFFDAPNYWRLGGPDIDEEDGTEIRNMRLELSGDVYTDYFYEFEMEFSEADVDIVDAYMGIRNVPYVGSIQFGQFAEPIGLEALGESMYLTFLERALPTLALIPYRSRGLAVSRPFLDRRLLLTAGIFGGGTDQESHLNVTGRLVAVPWYTKEGRRLLHLGLAYSRRNPNDDYRFSARPAHMANRHFDTGELPADDVELRAAEAALVLGPLSLQGEFIRADVSFLTQRRQATFMDLDEYFTLADRHFDGFYVQASYILTGENRIYNRDIGAFEGVIPTRNLSLEGNGWGAWEIAARYDEVSLDDFDVRNGVVGGEGRRLTFGLNWYVTPNLKLMLNYIRNHVDQFAYDGTLDIFQARVQASF